MAIVADDPVLQQGWREQSLALWIGAMVDSYSYSYPPALAGGFNTTFTMFMRSCPDVTTDWEGPTREAMARRFLEPATLGNARLSTQYRVLRLGHALAFGARGRLSNAEAGYLNAKGLPVHEGRDVRGSSRDAAGGLAVDFAFGYLGRRDGSRRTFALASRATAFVGRSGGDEVVARTTLTTRHGLEVPFARIGDDWIRPVVAPDGKGFLDEAAFARCCAGVEPWADSPFVEPPVLGEERGCPLAVLEAATPEGADASRNAGRREEAARACLERAGRLVSVDGIVHVRCPEPVLVPLKSYEDRRATDMQERDKNPSDRHPKPRVSVGWASGRFDCETDLGLLPSHMAPSPSWPALREARWPTFPLGHYAMARDVATAYAVALRWPSHVAVDHGTTATDVDPIGMLEGTLTSMPQVGRGTWPAVVARRDDVLKGLRSGDVKRLRSASLKGVSEMECLVGAIARVSISALKGKYEVPRSLDDESEVAAMAP